VRISKLGIKKIYIFGKVLIQKHWAKVKKILEIVGRGSG